MNCVRNRLTSFVVNSGYSSSLAQSVLRKTYHRSSIPETLAAEMIIEPSLEVDIKKQVEKFLESGGNIIACGTCLSIRKQEGGKECPAGNLEDWYRIVAE